MYENTVQYSREIQYCYHSMTLSLHEWPTTVVKSDGGVGDVGGVFTTSLDILDAVSLLTNWHPN